MAPNHPLPFKVGELAESKSFQKGFRGAWFRCKIEKFVQHKDQIKALLDFYDYHKEKHLTLLYQKPPRNYIRSTDAMKVQLILRPSFPPLYRENQMPDSSIESDFIVIVDDSWKVGDLVDWWSDGCYWSGKIICLLGEDKVKVKLFDPPVGEGESYDALINDLRPSLDWSLEHGWSVPENEGSYCCARLFWPQAKDLEGNRDCTIVSSSTNLASCNQISDSSAKLVASLLLPRDDKQHCNEVSHEVHVSYATGASVSSSTLGSTFVSPTGSTDPLLTPMLCYSTEDHEKEIKVMSSPTGSIDLCTSETSMCYSKVHTEMKIEVHSTKMNWDVDNGSKAITTVCDKESWKIPVSSCPLEMIEINTDIGMEETEGEFCSTTVNSDNCRETTTLFNTSQQGCGKQENTEVQSTDMVLESDRNDMMNSSDNTLITTSFSLLPPVELTNNKINKSSAHICPMEDTEVGSVRPTIENIDSDIAQNRTTSRLGKFLVTSDASCIPGACYCQTNDTFTEKLVNGDTVEEIQSMNMFEDENEGKREITNSVNKSLELHKVTSPLDEDGSNLMQLSEGLRITETHHTSKTIEENAIETSILELEELANKIKWLKSLIIFGPKWTNTMKPTWKFSETEGTYSEKM